MQTTPNLGMTIPSGDNDPFDELAYSNALVVVDTFAGPLNGGFTGTGLVVRATTPALAGLPTAPTPATADNSTKIATTAYVQAQGYVTSTTAPVTSVFGRVGAIVATGGDYTASQVTNAADKSSGSLQIFTAGVQAAGFQSVQALNATLIENFFAPGDTQPSFQVFSQGALAWGPGGATTIDVEVARIVSSPTGTGSFLELIKGAGLGYGTGAGGAVTQATSRTTAVTLNKPSGQITTNTTSLAAAATAAFTVNNSVVGADDTIILTLTNQGALTPLGLPCQIMAVANGSFTIAYTNNTGGSLVAALVFNFAVIKGAVA